MSMAGVEESVPGNGDVLVVVVVPILLFTVPLPFGPPLLTVSMLPPPPLGEDTPVRIPTPVVPIPLDGVPLPLDVFVPELDPVPPPDGLAAASFGNCLTK